MTFGDPTRIATIGLWILVLLLAVQFAQFARDTMTQETGGFGAYYTAAHVVREDLASSSLYDDAWFQQQIHAAGLDVRDIYRPNPPTVAVFFGPLAYLSHDQARVIWTTLGIIAVFASVATILRITGLRGNWIPATLAVVLVFQPLQSDIAHAQAYGFLLGAMTLVWVGYREYRSRLLGSALGFALAFKLLGVFVLGVLAIERRWRALLWSAAVATFSALGSLLWVDLRTWSTYGAELVRQPERPELSVTAYQTQSGLISRLLVSHEEWNPDPVFDVPMLALALATLSTLAVLAISGYAAVVSTDRDLTFALVVLVSVTLSPFSLDYHYTLLLLPAALLIAWGIRERSVWIWIIMLAGVVLVAADLPYQSARLADGPVALLAYPKLYGAWLLWGLCVFGCWRSSSSPARLTGQSVDLPAANLDGPRPCASA